MCGALGLAVVRLRHSTAEVQSTVNSSANMVVDKRRIPWTSTSPKSSYSSAVKRPEIKGVLEPIRSHVGVTLNVKMLRDSITSQILANREQDSGKTLPKMTSINSIVHTQVKSMI